MDNGKEGSRNKRDASWDEFPIFKRELEEQS